MNPRSLSSLLLLSFFLLGACTTQPTVDNNDIADEGGEDYYGPDYVDQSSPEESLSHFSIDESINEDGSYTFTVKRDGESLGTIDKEKPVDGYQSEIFDESDQAIYLGVTYTGRGGYILYGGYDFVYEINKETSAIRTIFGDEKLTGGFATDISPDGKWLAYFASAEDFSSDTLYIKSLVSEEVREFAVDSEFAAAGDAAFSPDGSKVAYAASVVNPDQEESAVFVIDLAIGEQTELVRKAGTYNINWQDNETPIAD